MKKEIIYKKNRCPLCNKPGKYRFFQHDRRTHVPGIFYIFHCVACDIDFIQPPNNLAPYYAYYDKDCDIVKINNFFFHIKKFMITSYYKNHSAFIRYIFSFFIDFVTCLPLKKGSIMDIGCGTGDILFLLKQSGFDAYGIEMNACAATTAKNQGLSHIQIGTEQKLVKHKNCTFDYIRASHVVEHMRKPQHFLSLSYKKLKLGGQLLIQTPNIDSIGQLFSKYAEFYDVPRHTVLFSKNGLIRLLKQKGFTDVNVGNSRHIFSSTYNTILIILRDKYSCIDTETFNRFSCNVFFNALFIPFDLIVDKLGKGQLITIIATK